MLILKELLLYTGASLVEKMMSNEPTGQYSRRIWFLYEWLFGAQLEIPDLKTGTYVEIVNSKLQYTGPTENSTRHRVKNNLPGTPECCPLVRRTETLEMYTSTKFLELMEKGLKDRDRDLIRRMSAFSVAQGLQGFLCDRRRISSEYAGKKLGQGYRTSGKKRAVRCRNRAFAGYCNRFEKIKAHGDSDRGRIYR